MIQPVSASDPRAVSRGSKKTYGVTSKGQKTGITNAQIALINAGGVAALTGAMTTAVARRYTPSWSYAGMLGLCSAFMAMFFMSPHVIENSGKAVAARKAGSEVVAKTEGSKITNFVKEHLKPSAKAIHFKQSA